MRVIYIFFVYVSIIYCTHYRIVSFSWLRHKLYSINIAKCLPIFYKTSANLCCFDNS